MTVTEGLIKISDISDLSNREVVAQFGYLGLQLLGKRTLVNILTGAPGVSSKTVKWVLNLWDSDENVRKDPNQLHRAMIDAGIPEKIAWRVANAIHVLFQENISLLQPPAPFFSGQGPQGQGIGMPGRYLAPFPPYSPSYGGYPQYSGFSQYGGYPPSSQPFYTAEDLRKAREESDRDNRLKKLEEKSNETTKSIEKLGEDVSKNIKDLKETITRPTATKTVEETIPIDAEGKPCNPEEAASIKKVIRPIETEKEDFVDQWKKLKEAGLIVGPAEIKDIVREEMPAPPAKSPDIEKLEEKLEAQAERSNKLEQQMQDQKLEHIKEGFESKLDRQSEELKTLRTELDARPRGAYSEDQFRFLDSTITKIAERQPVKIIVEFGEKLLGVPSTAPVPEATETVSPETRRPILNALAKRGYVVPR